MIRARSPLPQVGADLPNKDRTRFLEARRQIPAHGPHGMLGLTPHSDYWQWVMGSGSNGFSHSPLQHISSSPKGLAGMLPFVDRSKSLGQLAPLLSPVPEGAALASRSHLDKVPSPPQKKSGTLPGN